MLRRDLRELKAGVDLRSLVARTHELERSGKIRCPFHQERRPSCHIYPDGYKCFGCGAYGDHLSWLEHVEGLSLPQAIERLEQLAGRPAPPSRKLSSGRRASRRRPVAPEVQAEYQRLLRATHRLPAALEGRGLSLEDALDLGLAARGNDAILPLRHPAGELLALKVRLHPGPPRYRYLTAGCGTPAWLSPEVSQARALLLVEGELNGMLCHLALREVGAEVGVMGLAGVFGKLEAQLLSGKQIFVWADDDEAGRRAAQRWLRTARLAGSRSARALAGGPQDACDVAGAQGRLYLASWLLGAMRRRRRP